MTREEIVTKLEQKLLELKPLDNLAVCVLADLLVMYEAKRQRLLAERDTEELAHTLKVLEKIAFSCHEQVEPERYHAG